MTQDKDAFLRELLNDFKIEASEHLQSIVNGLLELETSSDSAALHEVVERIFRNTHSMKGAARAVNLLQIERVCMSLETVFHELKRGNLSFSASMTDVFIQATDLLEIMLKEIGAEHKTVSENSIAQISAALSALSGKVSPLPSKKTFSPPPPPPSFTKDPSKASTDLPEMIGVVNDKPTVQSEPDEAAPGKVAVKAVEKETIRVASHKLFDMLRMAEEMIAMKSGLLFYSRQLQQISSGLGLWKGKYEERLHRATAEAGSGGEEILKENELLKKHESDLQQLNKSLELLQRTSGRAIDDLILSIKKTLLQPFSTLFAIVPRIVRDLSKEYDKDIKLQLQGSEIEIDRRILEEMKDAMIHLIRNCIDHGIESREERKRSKKPATGHLGIRVSSDEAQKVVIEIRDDGAGINTKKLIESAQRAGIIKQSDANSMSEKQINMLIFSSGVSTSPFITDVSGRGLGMAIVAQKIAGLGGSIDIETSPGKGTTFLITLPQTLATFRGIVVKASESLFLIPTQAVFKALKILPDDIRTVEGRNTIRLNHETLGLVRLADVLKIRLHHTGKKSGALQGLVLQHAGRKLVFVIEDVLGEHEGVVKPLGQQLKHVQKIAGASILGDGKVVPVLNIPELLNAASGKTFSFDASDESVTTEREADQPVRVMVAEDSITVRNMLRNYLETAGFEVKTAFDGQEAYEKLLAEDVDIVVSDVEMPRMNGFELTAKIRSDTRLSRLPVVLVTALESPDDKRRGMDAGANAYIVKSSFEKSNLIDTINRLT